MAKVIDIVEGLKILAKYAPKGLEEHIGGADHDIIYGLDVEPKKITAEDRALLEKHGWSTGGGEEGYYHFA